MSIAKATVYGIVFLIRLLILYLLVIYSNYFCLNSLEGYAGSLAGGLIVWAKLVKPEQHLKPLTLLRKKVLLPLPLFLLFLYVK